jgi:hypothetical protein
MATFAMNVAFQGPGPSTRLPNPHSFMLKEEEFAHAYLSMEFWGGDVQSQSLTTGSPLQVTFGRPPTMRNFYGYVNHVGRVNNQLAQTKEGRNAICVYCVGASWPMKQQSTNIYLQQTNTQIIQQIANQFGLGSYIVPSSAITSGSKQQASLTYWEFCCQLAREIGYTFYCDGIQLVAKPRKTDPNNLSSLAAVYDYSSNPAGLPVFNPVLGTNSPGGGQLRNRTLAGVDATTLQPYVLTLAGSGTSSVLGVQQETPPFTDIAQYSSRNVGEAQGKLSGLGQLNQMYITATAVGPGNPQLAPGQLVFVQNANGSQNGLWFVTGVDHSLSSDNYIMTLYLGRDSIGQTATLSVVPQTNLPEEQAFLNNNVWQAA